MSEEAYHNYYDSKLLGMCHIPAAKGVLSYQQKMTAEAA